MPHVVVREFARLTTDPLSIISLDQARVTESAFNWLCQESARLRQHGAPLVQIDGRHHLRLDNYVGVIETPCGTIVEILPKTLENFDDKHYARKLLRKMLERCLRIDSRVSQPTNLETFDRPVDEWIMRQFLSALDAIIKRGVRFDYHAVREEQRFLRGRLDITRQLRQPPGRQHLFQIEHDIFDADRPENRLLRSALDCVCRRTRDADNWRLSHELAVYLAPVPCSANVKADFRRWRDDRLLAHYQPSRPWCELILNEQSPLSVLGEWRGNSLLFPMERLFERYVELCLRQALPSGATLTCAPAREHLATHNAQQWFELRPDFLLTLGARTIVLDTKWKLLDASLSGAKDKYKLQQSDFYQLFAYAHRYLPSGGELMLVYPKTSTFCEALPPFRFSEIHTLWVVPFDLDRDELITESLTLSVSFPNCATNHGKNFQHAR